MTDVQICNLALSRIGGLPIVTIGEATVNGELCQRFYQPVYDRSLRAHDWKCATERAQLAQIATPVFEWRYAYSLPADPFCLRVIQLERREYEFTVEGRRLLTNETTAKIKYIGRILPGNLDPLCTQYIYLNLSKELAFPITGDMKIVTALHEEIWQQVMPEATKADAIEELIPDFDKIKSGWLDSRISGMTTISNNTVF